jgi:hypothetical protein
MVTWVLVGGSSWEMPVEVGSERWVVAQAFHEDYTRVEEAKGGSERSLGVVFAVVFLVIGLWPVLGGAGVRPWALGLAALFALAAVVRPAVLAPVNRAWTRLGGLLHRVVTPLVMGLLFFATVTPTALIMRVFGKHPLPLRFDRKAKTYWIERHPPGPAPETMRNQF